MQLLMMFPLMSHLFRIRTQRKQVMIEGILAILLVVVAWFVSSPIINAGILLLCLFLDTRKNGFLCIFVAILFYLSHSLEYALLLWVLIEQGFVWYGTSVYHSYEVQLQEYQNKVFDRQVKEVEHMFLQMRGWRHDYHNHLQNLKAKLKQGNFEDSQLYLNQLEHELDDIKLLVETGNANMDAILNSKLSLAVNQGIELHVKAKVPASITMSDTDICALLGNLVDNAVEACFKVDQQPFLRLYINQYKGQLYISCTNATNELVRKLDSDYISTKRGNHGHGLKRMNQIVEKYHGSIVRKNEPGVFITELMLPL